jgi:hypothetical protein
MPRDASSAVVVMLVPPVATDASVPLVRNVPLTLRVLQRVLVL